MTSGSNDDPRVDGPTGTPPLAATVEYVAPAPVVVASRLGAPREVRGRGHQFVVGAVTRRRVGFAPPHVENFLARVGIRLTAGTVRAGDTRSFREVVRHRSMARIDIAIPFSLRSDNSTNRLVFRN